MISNWAPFFPVEKDHNAFITGQGGTGKSFLIGEIFRSLERNGENVSIICSSGIATTVYDDIDTYVKTVHSHFGLQTAELSKGGGVCSLLRAKCRPWIPLVRHILVLVPRFDREFVMTFQGHGSGC